MKVLIILALLHGAWTIQNEISGFTPHQIHIAFGEKITDVVVMWATKKDPGESIVLYGEKDTTHKVTGKRFKFDKYYSLPQFFHKATMKDLKYNTKYVYKVGSTKHSMSETFSFWIPPAGANNSVRALFFGDMGYPQGKTHKALQGMLQDVKASRWDVVVHNGDLAYDLDNDNGTRGDNFMNMVQPLAANIQYMVSPGNHENEWNFSQYINRYHMPRHEASQNMFYSFDIGLVHFVAVSTEAYWDCWWRRGKHDDWNSTLHYQYDWLVKDLKEANKNRANRPWIVLFGHRPMYCSSSTGADLCRHNGGENVYPHRIGIPEFGGLGLEDILMDFGVDLVIWAHEHQYERTWPVYKSKVYNGTKGAYINPGAPTHFTTGAAGCNEGTDGFVDDPFAWSAFRARDYGYGRLYAINKTHLHMEEISTQNDIPKLIDEFWLIRDEHKPYR